MRRVGKHLSAIMGRVLFIGFSIQVALGMLWLLCNFGARQDFAPRGDGILYPVLLWLAPHYCFVYILQIVVALWAGYFFLKMLCPNLFWNVWGSLAILTIPVGMQCHLALLPDSLVGSLMLVECTLFWCAVKPREGQNRTMIFAGMGVCWILLAFLNEMYFYFGGILPLVLILVMVCGRERFRMIPLILLFAAFAGIIFGVYDLAQTTGKYNREQKRAAEMVFDRFVWSTILKEREEDRPQSLTASAPGWVTTGASYYADGLSRELEPVLLQTLSQEEMDELFKEWAGTAWERYSKRIIHECGWDLAGYIFSPTITGLMLHGRGCISYCLRNYDIMSRETPKLTRYYVDYGCWWFSVALFLAMLLTVIHVFVAKQVPARWKIGCLAAFAFACGCLVIWYVMQGAGIMDYKRTIFIAGLWVVWQVQEISNDGFKREKTA